MIILLLLGLSCTPIPPGQVEEKADRAEAEKDFDPLAQDAQRPVVIQPRKSRMEESIPPLDETGRLSESGDLAGPERPGVAQGYRVQIFISDDLREASRILAEARERFDQDVYLEYDAPYYKVRVGDCRTEREADELLKVVRRLGYPDAWLVRTVISIAGEEVPDESSP